MSGPRRHPSNGLGARNGYPVADGEAAVTDPLAPVKRELHDALMQRVLGRGVETLHPAARRLLIREEALAVLREEGHLLPQEALARVVNEVSDRVVGLGPIESLLRDPEVSEVMVNGADDVYVERKGRLERVGHGLFEGEEAVLHVIERIVAPLGLRVDESSPWVDARLPDGSRVHALIPPLSLCGPVLNIRKFSLIPFSATDLVGEGSLGPRMLEFLAACVRGKANVVISGGTSSGKTTLLNVLASFIPDRERLITIEDAAELRLGKPHVVRLEARPPNVEGRGEVTVRQLVRNALRMRPDRIIVGEVRGPEALDMLQALNTGHEGSLSTAHANSPHHLLWRLETMALMSDVDLPAAHIREQVAAAVDVVVHMARMRDGRRAALHVSVVEGCRDGEPVVREVFSFRPRGGSAPEGEFVATGAVPDLTEVLAERGEQLPPRLFEAGPDVPDSPGGANRGSSFERIPIGARLGGPS